LLMDNDLKKDSFKVVPSAGNALKTMAFSMMAMCVFIGVMCLIFWIQNITVDLPFFGFYLIMPLSFVLIITLSESKDVFDKILISSKG
jgi:hypothetical protein